MTAASTSSLASSMNLDEKIARLKETAARKVAESKARKPAAPDRQLKLELWPEEVRGVPNAILRGALFGVGQERTVHKKRTLVAAVEGYEIRFKGETFNQTDLDVLEGMLHIAMPHPLGKRVEFSVHSFLKALGRKTSGGCLLCADRSGAETANSTFTSSITG